MASCRALTDQASQRNVDGQAGKIWSAGFSSLTINRRSISRAHKCGFPMSGRNGRGLPLPVP